MSLDPKPGPGLRPPTSDSRKHGRIENPPRFAKIGGFTGPSSLPKGDDLDIVKPGGRAK